MSRRRFQFRLRTLVLVVPLVAIVLVYARRVHTIQRRADLYDEQAQLSTEVGWDNSELYNFYVARAAQARYAAWRPWVMPDSGEYQRSKNGAFGAAGEVR